jgi:hypothetical protein
MTRCRPGGPGGADRAEAGIRQFLDLGAGLPANGNVHQVAEAATAGARVVYVDNDPSVLAHAQALTAGDRTAVIQSDLRDPAAILAHPPTRGAGPAFSRSTRDSI